MHIILMMREGPMSNVHPHVGHACIRHRHARLKEVSVMHSSKRTLKLKKNKKQRRGTYINALPIMRCCFESRSFTQYQIEANRIGLEL